MTNREKDLARLHAHLAALLEEYGSITISLPGGPSGPLFLRDGDQPLLRISLGHRCPES